MSLDSSFTSVCTTESLYVPTPQKRIRDNFPIIPIPNKMCFFELKQLDIFIQQLNSIRCCSTRGCTGVLIPSTIKSIGLGGAVSIFFTCNGCFLHHAHFESSVQYEGTSEVSIAVQVAFMVAGCTHANYYRALKQALGMDTVSPDTFMSTIVRMYPVVKQMVDEMCKEAKNDMKSMDQTQLGSWSRAVTSADGTWMTRGFHSKNATFSVRNDMAGILLYYVHLCQRGRDKVVQEELYQGTSKAAEGYGAHLTMERMKEEGMHIEVHWQDADSSSSNAVQEHFGDVEVMICGGHAGRAHEKQLEKFAKLKSFSQDFQSRHLDKFLQVSHVTCHCENRHKILS